MQKPGVNKSLHFKTKQKKERKKDRKKKTSENMTSLSREYKQE